MIRWELPWDDMVLQLSPRWGGSSVVGPFAWTGLIVAVFAGLLVWLYRYEMRLVRGVTALWLCGLRAAALFILLGVVVWQPSLAHISTHETPSRVVIAIDYSGSMDLRDPQRTPWEKLRLARALNLPLDGQAPSAALLDFWIDQYARQPTATTVNLLRPGEGGDDALERRRLAEQYQRLHDHLCAEVDGLSRRQIVQHLLGASGRKLLDRLAAKHQMELVGFDDAWWTQTTLDVAGPGRPAHGTDLRQPLLRGVEANAKEAGPLLGVVILSDGRHTRGDDPLSLAKELKQRNIPIYAIGLGCERPAPDLAVVEVTAPANVFHDVDASVEARVKAVGLPPGELAVELSIAGKPPRPEHRRTLTHHGADQIFPVRFNVRFDEPGVYNVEVKARPMSAKIQEANLTNNQGTATIRSLNEEVRVLMIDGEARWEYHYLASALIRDPQVQAERVVFVQPRIGALTEDHLEKIGHPKVKLAEIKDGLDPLRDFDCIILGDVSATQLPLADRRRLEQYVAERGGALILVAGKRFLPLDYRGAELAGDPLVKMLPITDLRPVRPEDGFRLVLTEEGYNSPFLQMEPDAAANRKKWSEFPVHYWGVEGRLKPGATRLAFAMDPKKKDAPATTDALFAQQRYGAGHVLYLGIDSTWRWRFKSGDTHHHRFWGQALRWAAADKLLPAGNKVVRFGTREAVHRSDQPVDIAVRFHPEAGPLPADLAPRARILPVDFGQPVAVTTLSQRPGQPRLFTAQVRDLIPGRYRVEVDLPPGLQKFAAGSSDKKKPDRAAEFTIKPPEDVETKDLTVDWQLLSNLARQSGGEFFTAETVDRLVDLLERRVTRHDVPEQLRPWRDEPAVWWLLGVILTLLSLEWISRKLAGLP